MLIDYCIHILSYFCSSQPRKLLKAFKRAQRYIHGVRPGNGTEQYLSKLLTRLATVGALFLSFVALLPIIAQNLFGLSSNIAFLGTSLIIVISTSIEGIKQLEGYLLKRKYVGFLGNYRIEYRLTSSTFYFVFR